MYRLAIYETTGTTTPKTTLFEGDFRVERWSKRISAPGKLAFSMYAFHAKATEDNLLPYRRVELLRRDSSGTYQKVWFGYIEAYKQIGINVEVICQGMLNLFKKRFTAASTSFTGQGSTEAFGLLTDTNNDDGATGITTGSGGVTTTRNLTIGRTDLLRAWEYLAKAHTAEFEINDNGVFDFVSTLGSDKSGTLTLRFRRDGEPGSGIRDIRLGADGEPMVNRVIGHSSVGGGISYQYDNATSQATYGVLIEHKTFNEAQNISTLTPMTTVYGTQRANPAPDFRIEPELESQKVDPVSGTRTLSGLSVEDIVVGDLITADILSENQTVSATKRIVEIVVEVDDSGKERLLLTLSESGIFISASYLDESFADDIKRRLRDAEALL